MRVEDLSIGDWVISPHPAVPNPIRVKEIYDRNVGYKNGVLHMSFIEPIPLTPEILEKNGFNVKEEDETHTTYVSVLDENSTITFAFFKETTCGVDAIFECEKDFNYCLDRIRNNHIRYVHQLQHALRLCGTEKEIEL